MRAARGLIAGSISGLLLAAGLSPTLVHAVEAQGTTIRLRGATLSAGGGVGAQGTGPAPQVGSAGGTLGETPVPPTAAGAASGVQLRGGIWAVVSRPAGAVSDRDGDGVADAVDDCPDTRNPSQLDRGGLGAGSGPDGIGDACQCGDVTGDGRVSIADSVEVQRSLLQPPTAKLHQPTLCDVGSTAGCTLSDAVVIRRALLGPPTATLQAACAGAPE